MPSEEFGHTSEYPSKSRIPLHEIVQPGAGFSLSCATDEGEDSSTLVLRKSPRAESNSSLDASSTARSTPRRLNEKDEKAAYGAKQLLDKIKEVENMANDWAKNNADEKSADRVKELVTLREALCDDFAADLDLYIAFYCVSNELDEGQRSAAQVAEA
jgi:hypothetical protein